MLDMRDTPMSAFFLFHQVIWNIFPLLFLTFCKGRESFVMYLLFAHQVDG